MNPIRILPDILANQVAAGEVVDRPVSVVKELVENSLDAGASHIRIDFSRGGVAWIRVSDDGEGMAREDALQSLERHATNKIRNIDDLMAIDTFGFRGEAIPSIASISQFKMTTRRHKDTAAVEITVHGGRLDMVRESGAPKGTAVDVRSLFFNVPARRKFLRAENTEAAHIRRFVEVAALAHPGVAFQLVKDGDSLIHAGRASSLAERVRGLFGIAEFHRLREVPSLKTHGMEIHGFVGREGEGKADRGSQFFYVNRRPVRDLVLRRALEEAAHRLLPKGRYPMAVLFLDIDPAQVDCNVHPTKREVKFRHPQQVRDAVVKAVTEAWRPTQTVAIKKGETKKEDVSPFKEKPQEVHRAFIPPSTPEFEEVARAVSVRPSQEVKKNELDFSYRGRLGKHYVLLESVDGLVILDTVAASERIWYEELLKEVTAGGVRSQNLLFPEVFEIAPKEMEEIASCRDVLLRGGFVLEVFGSDSIKVDALPVAVGNRSAREVLGQILPVLRHVGASAEKRILEDALAKGVSRLAAPFSSLGGESEVLHLLEALFRCVLPYVCPMGRPTLIELGFPEIERKFGRISG